LGDGNFLDLVRDRNAVVKDARLMNQRGTKFKTGYSTTPQTFKVIAREKYFTDLPGSAMTPSLGIAADVHDKVSYFTLICPVVSNWTPQFCHSTLTWLVDLTVSFPKLSQI